MSNATKDSIIFNICVNYISSDKLFIYDYGTDYEELKEDLQLLYDGSQSLSLANSYCMDLLRAYMCNYVYPGCSYVTGLPQGICKEECSRYVLDSGCPGFAAVEGVSNSLQRLSFTRQCDDTLIFLRDYDINTESIGRGDCFNITGKTY